MEMYIIISLVVGLFIGLALGIVIARTKHNLTTGTDDDSAQNTINKELEHLQKAYQETDKEKALESERLKYTQHQLNDKEDNLRTAIADNDALRRALNNTNNQLASLHTKLEEEAKNNHDKQQFMKESVATLEKHFQATAAEVLMKTSEALNKQQDEKLQITMKPLQEHLHRFEKDFKGAFEKEARDHISLREHIKTLGDLNSKLSAEASALAKALKGDSKFRGNWGEHILEHILQSSGLREGHEYSTQESFIDKNNARLQPDVLITLPDNKSIIIDSKVTLNSWIECMNAENDEQRERTLKTFLSAIRQHIKSLSDKQYHKIYQITTLDFILMFIPIETAFLHALENDPSLYDDAHKQNIILVSPTTLMAVLKTIAVNWKYNRQEKNTLLIAKEAEKLLDKIYSYMEVFMKAKNSLSAANKHMDSATLRFATGTGSVLSRVEKIKGMGIKSAKKMGIEWEQLNEDEDHETGS